MAKITCSCGATFKTKFLVPNKQGDIKCPNPKCRKIVPPELYNKKNGS